MDSEMDSVDICDINIDVTTGMIYIYIKNDNIQTIKYDDQKGCSFEIKLKWNILKDIFEFPQKNLFDTFDFYLQSLSSENLEILSSSSLNSLNPDIDTKEYLLKIFIRGFCSITTLMKLNRMEMYFKRIIEGSINQNNLKLFRMMIHFHSIYENDSSLLLKYSMDFIHRWSPMLKKGEKVDKYNFLSLLILSYIPPQWKRIDSRDGDRNENEKYSDIEKRLQKIEKILGI